MIPFLKTLVKESSQKNILKQPNKRRRFLTSQTQLILWLKNLISYRIKEILMKDFPNLQLLYTKNMKKKNTRTTHQNKHMMVMLMVKRNHKMSSLIAQISNLMIVHLCWVCRAWLVIKMCVLVSRVLLRAFPLDNVERYTFLTFRCLCS